MAPVTSIDPGRLRLRRLATPELTEAEVAAIRAILMAAFGPDEDERFSDEDWEHALGGRHFVLELDGEIVSHASVVVEAGDTSGSLFSTKVSG